MAVGPFPASWRGSGPAPGAPGTAALRALGRTALAERHRWPLWLPVALGAGAAFYFALPQEPDTGVAVAAGAVALAASVGAIRLPHVTARALLALIAASALGFAAAKARAVSAGAPVLARALGPTHVTGRVEDVEMRAKGVRVVLGDLASGRFRDGETPARARISIRYGGGRLVPGQWIQLTAALYPPPGPAEPGAYDFGRAAYFARIGVLSSFP